MTTQPQINSNPAPRPTPAPSSTTQSDDKRSIRDDVKRRAQADRFSSKLEQEGTGRVPPRPNAKSRDEMSDRQLRQGDDAEGKGAFGMLSASSFAVVSPPQAQTAFNAQLDRAMIDRIAAQIAEARAGDGGALEVSFPEGFLAASAMIERNAAGALAIQVVGLDPNLSPLYTSQLKATLHTALERRKLRVASLTMELASEREAQPFNSAGRPSRPASSDQSV